MAQEERFIMEKGREVHGSVTEDGLSTMTSEDATSADTETKRDHDAESFSVDRSAAEDLKRRENRPWCLRVLCAPVTYVIVALAVVRVIFGNAMGMWFAPNQDYDDALLMRYSFPSHYTSPDIYSLAKSMAFPWFIDVCHVLHINLAVGISLLWVMAALAVFFTIRMVTNGNLWISGFGYAYVLFCPTAFEAWCGTRMYRNCILAPSYILVFALAVAVLMMIVGNGSRNASLIMVSVALGFVLSFAYYIADNGTWIVFSLAAAAALAAIVAVFKFFHSDMPAHGGASPNGGNRGASRGRRLVAALIAICIPFATLAVATAGYKAVNKRFFGVAETNTRVEGELGGFIERLYRIDSPWRTNEIWAPNDAVHQAMDASATLRAQTSMCQYLLHSPWAQESDEPDGVSTHGDLMTWGLRWALDQSGTWKSERQVSDLFHVINGELDEAFANGTLKKTDRIMITSEMGGFYPQEINGDFVHLFLSLYNGNILLHGYTPGAKSTDGSTKQELADSASYITRLPYISGTGEYSGMSEHWDRMNSIAAKIFAVYRVINVLLVVLIAGVSVLGLVAMIVRCGKKRHVPRLAALSYLAMLGLGGVSVAYSFSIAWFVQYVVHPYSYRIDNFYSLGNVALFVMCAVLATAFVTQMLKTRGIMRPAKEPAANPGPSAETPE